MEATTANHKPCSQQGGAMRHLSTTAPAKFDSLWLPYATTKSRQGTMEPAKCRYSDGVCRISSRHRPGRPPGSAQDSPARSRGPETFGARHKNRILRCKALTSIRRTCRLSWLAWPFLLHPRSRQLRASVQSGLLGRYGRGLKRKAFVP